MDSGEEGGPNTIDSDDADDGVGNKEWPWINFNALKYEHFNRV